MQNFNVEKGKVIPRSVWQTLRFDPAWICFVPIAIFATLGGVAIGVRILVLGSSMPKLWGAVFGGCSMALLGLGCSAFCTWKAVNRVRLIRSQGRFIISKQCLQYVTKDGDIEIQLPLENIVDIDFKPHEYWSRQVFFVGPMIFMRDVKITRFRYIAIMVGNAKRNDTLVAPKVEEWKRKQLECDVAIFDCYKLPLYDLYYLLVDQWEEHCQSSSNELINQRRLPPRATSILDF